MSGGAGESGDHVYEVAVDAPLFSTLSYTQPLGFTRQLPTGTIVLAPLGGRQVTGYVLGMAQEPEADVRAAFQLRSLADVLSLEPFFPPILIPFYRWIAQYYHYPIGEVIRTALPLAPGASSGRSVVLLDRERLSRAVADPEPQPDWLAQLTERGRLSPAAVRRIWRTPQEQRHLLALVREGAVALTTELLHTGGRVKTEEVVQADGALAALCHQAEPLPREELLHALNEKEPQHPLGKSETKLLEIFLAEADEQGGHREPVARSQLRKAYTNYAPALKRLVARGLLSLQERRVVRDPFAGLERQPPTLHVLSAEQQAVLEPIVAAVQARSFSPFLLHGVTGSGKTEIYLQAVATALTQRQSALILVPEITLAAQLETEVRARFGGQVAVLHSGMSDGERVDQWQQVLQGHARIVLGARSAVFAPLTDLGLIIVDEEHESSYKQEEGLPYHGRDLAVLRARQENCPVLLGSATPALTSYYHALNGKYRLLHLPERITAQPLPRVQLVDMRSRAAMREHPLFSGELLAAMRENLAQGRQTLLFLNRRGFASFMQCQDCGFVVQCRHCQVSLTLHRAHNQLLCHYCGYRQRPDTLCPVCGSSHVLGRGLGTERIEDEALALFPSARIARIDSDSGKNRRQLLALLQTMQRREIDILIGTQMIAKGLHFPHVTLVGVLWADAGLCLPDFRAGERTFAQLSQVTGRAGRGENPGLVIIQSYQPDHYAVRLARFHDYSDLYTEEIALRRQLAYPPFTRLVNLRCSGMQEEEVRQGAAHLARFARTADRGGRVMVLGPVAAPLARIKDRVRWHILLKSADTAALHQLCEDVLAHRKKLCPAGVSVQLDVDPENML